MAEDIRDNDSLIIRDREFELSVMAPKPDFMLIGGAKCGTTSFTSYLSFHPQVHHCNFKEPNFWSWKLCTKEQYQSLFVNQSPIYSPFSVQKIAGDYSTSHLFHPIVPRRVRGILPDTKLIVLLRNPVDRAYSHYIMSKRAGLEVEHSFDEIIRKEIDEVPALIEAHNRGFFDPNANTDEYRLNSDGTPISISSHDKNWTSCALTTDKELFRFYYSSYVFRSIYYDQMNRWLKLFPSQQFKIIQSERFFSDRQTVMNEVVDFLGLQPHNFTHEEIGHTFGGGSSNQFKPSDYEKMEDDTRKLLTQYFAPHNKKLFELIGETYDWDVD